MQAAWLLVVVVIGEAIVVTIGLTFWDRGPHPVSTGQVA